MRLRGKRLQQVSPEEVGSLITDEFSENVELDYKETLPSLPSERTEFAKDAAAMANTRGGVLLFGIKERVQDGKNTGIPERIVGLGDIAPDHELRRLEQVIRDQTDPALTGSHAQLFKMSSGEVVVGVGVPRSLLAPHAVGGRYYRRSTTGNYPVETRELRQMFLERDEWGREAENFRRSRIAPAGLEALPDEPTWSSYLHVLPLGRLTEIVNLIAHQSELARLEPLARANCDSRPNLDGHITYWPSREGCNRFTQWFRFGGIEVASAHHLFKDPLGTRKLDATRVANDAARFTRVALKFMTERLGLDPPFVVFLSLLGTLKVPISVEGWEHRLDLLDQPNEIDVPQLLLPGVVIQEVDSDVKDELMPTFDMIWQAAGFNECFLRRATQPWG